MSASVEAVAPEYTARHWHGVSGDSSWQPPVLAVESAAPVRADQVSNLVATVFGAPH